jgi:methyltransferase
MTPLILLVVVFVPMLIEARIAGRHDRVLRAAGAVEPPGDVYQLMQVAYPACFLAMAAEAWIRGTHVAPTLTAGVCLFTLSKGLKYWAIATLRGRWTFRVLVPPGSSRVTTGPYRFMRHPNYLSVIGELIGIALIARAPIGGVIATVGFGLLIVARIRVEDRALGLRPA